MSETMELKYGLNPQQAEARLVFEGPTSPLQVLNGKPGYINLLDAFAAWQLVRNLRAATDMPSAASFKHVSPAGAAIGKPLDDTLREVYMVGEAELSPLAAAYARARGADRLSSFGDMAALSDIVDVSTANLIKPEVSDGVIAPGYEPEALEILKQKKKGGYLVMQMDPHYRPEGMEVRDAFGFRLEQSRDTRPIGPELLENVATRRNDLDDEARLNLIVATVALKYTQSNSVTVAYDGQVIGTGAGQQSRVHCVRLACGKADKWFLQQHPKVRELKFIDGLKRPEKVNVIDQYLLWDDLSDAEVEEVNSKLTEYAQPLTHGQRLDWIKKFKGVVLSSDAFFPFRDSIDRASRSSVQFVLQPGGSLRDDLVVEAADQYKMTMVLSGVRWFLH